MKTRVYIVAILSAMSIAVSAQSFMTSDAVDKSIQSQQLVRPITSYDGTVYEPFDNTTPSEKSAYGPAKAPGHGGIKKDFGKPDDPGNQSNEFPIGDGMWGMMAMALAFCGVITLRRRRAANNVER